MSDSRRILVNSRQRGNPILACITNVPYEFAEISADYQVGRSTNVFYLSLRYHALKPEYIHDRLKEAGKLTMCTVLLLLVDSKDLDNLFNEVNKLCVIAGISLVMAFSNEEAAQYLELFKLNENKPPDALMGKRQTDLLTSAVDFLTSIKPINKSDAIVLIKTFKTVSNILLADKKALSVVPGLGQRKVDAFYKAVHSDSSSKEKASKQTLLSQFFGQSSNSAISTAECSASNTTPDAKTDSGSATLVDESTSSSNICETDLIGFAGDDYDDDDVRDSEDI